MGALISQQVATSTALGLVWVEGLYNATFQILRGLVPYVVGIVVLGIILHIGWSLLRHASGR